MHIYALRIRLCNMQQLLLTHDVVKKLQQAQEDKHGVGYLVAMQMYLTFVSTPVAAHTTAQRQ